MTVLDRDDGPNEVRTNFGLSSSARTVVRAKGEDWSVPERYAAAPPSSTRALIVSFVDDHDPDANSQPSASVGGRKVAITLRGFSSEKSKFVRPGSELERRSRQGGGHHYSTKALVKGSRESKM